jgi:hypothetical protein
MGHIGVKGLRSAVNNIPFDDSSLPSCEICTRANICRSSFPTHASNRANCLLECIHCNICGPLPPCYGQFRYYILFIDIYSRFITLFLMRTRDEAPTLFTQFKMAAENHTGTKISLLCVDNAPELIHGQMEAFCKQNGIIYEKTVPDSPSQNGVAERANLTICSMACAMLINADLRNFFWLFAVLTATHIKQRVLHAALSPGVTPFELLFHRKPDLSYLRPFGVKCTSQIIANQHSKFEPRGDPGHFLGYAKDAKGYLVWITSSHGGSLKVRQDVTFHDFLTPKPSPNVPLPYKSLWDNIGFPDRLHIDNPQPSTDGLHPAR